MVVKFTNWPKPKHDLIMAKVSIIIDGEDGFGLHDVPGKEAVVETILFCADNLQVWARRSFASEYLFKASSATF